MPKSKRRKKRSKKKKGDLIIPEARSRPLPASKEPRLPFPKSGQKRSIRERLYANQAEGLFTLVTYLPFFAGAWLFGGLVLDDVMVFIILSTAIILAHFCNTIKDRNDIVFARELSMVLYAAQGGIVFAFYNATKSVPVTGLAVLTLILTAVEGRTKHDKPSKVLFCGTSLVVRMSIMGILGAYSQLFSKPEFATAPAIIIEHGILGFVPGMVLASALIARNTGLFEKNSWHRSRMITKKDGTEVKRPGALSTSYSCFLVFGPVVPVSVAPLGIFPSPFLLCALAFFAIPKMAQAFFEKTIDDELMVIHTVNLAAALALLVFIAGILTKVVY